MQLMGIICASSNIITLLARLCSFLHFEARFEKSDSKNCTAVVTMTGASQFSVALACRIFSGEASPSMSNTTALWCSKMFSSPKILRKVSAVCSIIEV